MSKMSEIILDHRFYPFQTHRDNVASFFKKQLFSSIVSSPFQASFQPIKKLILN